MIKKLKSRKGVSLSELLMVVLILALLISIIGGGVVVVKNAYEKITLKAEAQILMSTTITKVKDELRYAKDITSGEPLTFIGGGYDTMGTTIWFENGGEGTGKDSADERGIILCTYDQRQQLLTDSTMSSSLTPELTYSYDSSANKFSATITIYHGDSRQPFLSQTITVDPINNEIH